MGNQKKKSGTAYRRSVILMLHPQAVPFSFCRKSVVNTITGQTANCAPSRKSGCHQSVSGAVAVSQHPFNVGFTVEDFTA